MSETPARCSACGKTAPECGIEVLNQCARCKNRLYCSRDCQKADWKTHKKTCQPAHTDAENDSTSINRETHEKTCAESAHAGAETKSNRSSAYSGTVLETFEHHPPDPFTRLDEGTYLLDRPKQDVYALLIASFRLRVEDDIKYIDQPKPDIAHAAALSDIGFFRKYLEKAAARPGLLPTWWTPDTQRECEDLLPPWWSPEPKQEYKLITKGSREHNMFKEFTNEDTPILVSEQGETELRMLAETITGVGAFGYDTTKQRKFLRMVEYASLKDK